MHFEKLLLRFCAFKLLFVQILFEAVLRLDLKGQQRFQICWYSFAPSPFLSKFLRKTDSWAQRKKVRDSCVVERAHESLWTWSCRIMHSSWRILCSVSVCLGSSKTAASMMLLLTPLWRTVFCDSRTIWRIWEVCDWDFLIPFYHRRPTYRHVGR